MGLFGTCRSFHPSREDDAKPRVNVASFSPKNPDFRRMHQFLSQNTNTERRKRPNHYYLLTHRSYSDPRKAAMKLSGMFEFMSKSLKHSSVNVSNNECTAAPETSHRCSACDVTASRCVCDHTNLEARLSSYPPQHREEESRVVRDHTNVHAWNTVFH
jgi:hypothetical protein